jgi:hypothetical protein
MDIISTAHHLEILFELFERDLIGTADLNIAMALAQTGKLVERNPFRLDLFCWRTALKQLVAVPSPGTLPLTLWVNLQ